MSKSESMENRFATVTASFDLSSRDKSLNEIIAQQAYDLYLKRGRIDGYDVQDWLEAERKILAKMDSKEFLGQWVHILCGWGQAENR